MERTDRPPAITPATTLRATIDSLERMERDEQFAVLCFLAAQAVEIDEAERNAAVRRCELLLAAGGDPHRTPELHGRAVTALATDLDTPNRRAALQASLAALAAEVAGAPRSAESLARLRADADLAWQVFALAVLADALADDD